MYLLLGDLQDSCCVRVRHELEARNYPVRVVSNPLVDPWRFAWRFNNEESVSQLGWGEEPPVTNDQIAGVLVRTSGWIDPLDWEPEDLAYMQAETMLMVLRNLLKSAHAREQKGEPLTPPAAPQTPPRPVTARAR